MKLHELYGVRQVDIREPCAEQGEWGFVPGSILRG